MPSSYPNAFDVLTGPQSTAIQTDHALRHANAEDAVEAVQAMLGLNPQGAYPTVADRIAAAASIGIVGMLQNTSASGSITIDTNTYQSAYLVLTGNVTGITLTGTITSTAGRYLRIIVQQDAVGGRTITWPVGVIWGDGGPPIMPAAANALLMFELFARWNGSSVVWYGSTAPRWLLDSSTSSVALTTGGTSEETLVDAAIPAGVAQAGDFLHLFAWGTYAASTNGNPQPRMRLKLPTTTTVLDTSTQDFGWSSFNHTGRWWLNAYVAIISPAASQLVTAKIEWAQDGVAGVTWPRIGAINRTGSIGSQPATADLTAATTLRLTGQFQSAVTGTTITRLGYFLQRMRRT